MLFDAFDARRERFTMSMLLLPYADAATLLPAARSALILWRESDYAQRDMLARAYARCYVPLDSTRYESCAV